MTLISLHAQVLAQIHSMEQALVHSMFKDVDSWKLRLDLRDQVHKGVWQMARVRLAEESPEYRILGQKLEEIMAEIKASQGGVS